MISLHLQYKDWGSYNNPKTNERNIELPLGFWFLEEHPLNTIEIGEVTAMYHEAKHPVYDLSSADASRRKDVFDINMTGCNVLSISTVEHVGFGDYGNKPEPHLAIEAIKKIRKEASRYLITFPVGYNIELDDDLMTSGIPYFLMERDADNKWYYVRHKDLTKFKYNSPYYAGNAICVITNTGIDLIEMG